MNNDNESRLLEDMQKKCGKIYSKILIETKFGTSYTDYHCGFYILDGMLVVHRKETPRFNLDFKAITYGELVRIIPINNVLSILCTN